MVNQRKRPNPNSKRIANTRNPKVRRVGEASNVSHARMLESLAEAQARDIAIETKHIPLDDKISAFKLAIRKVFDETTGRINMRALRESACALRNLARNIVSYKTWERRCPRLLHTVILGAISLVSNEAVSHFGRTLTPWWEFIQSNPSLRRAILGGILSRAAGAVLAYYNQVCDIFYSRDLDMTPHVNLTVLNTV